MPEPRKITFIAGTLAQGGAERQLFAMARCLHERGDVVQIAAFRAGEHWEGRLRELGIDVRHVALGRGRVARLHALHGLLRSDRPDVVQSAHFFTNLYAVLAARRLGCADIGAVRSDLRQEFSNHGWLGRRGLFWPRTLAVNSAAAAAAAAREGADPGKIVVVPNIVDVDALRGADADRHGTGEILYVGRLAAPKRVDRLLAVASALKASTTQPFRFTLLGEGPDRAQLEEDARRRGLSEKEVRFLGKTDDVRTHYHSSAALLLTSDHEGTPNVVLEAMACGVPVVATNIGGVPDLVRNKETGYLRAPDDVTGLAEDLAHLLAHPAEAQAMGERAAEHVRAHHSPQVLQRALDHLYAHALKQAPR